MILPESFSQQWINSHRSNSKFAKINPPIVEKMIYALALLEALVRHKLNFVFKGGTSLVILMPEPKRFSVDIDILTQHTKDELEKTFNNISTEGLFIQWEIDAPRSYLGTIPKAHYLFRYNPQLNLTAGYILLDILFEEHCYPVILSAPIKSTWIVVSDNPFHVQAPSIESILGDKLTAFAPNTTGVLYGKNKSLEIVKQLHDVGHLFDRAGNVEIIANSFSAIVSQEIAYRKLGITANEVLDDIISTALLISQTPRNHSPADATKYQEIHKGISQFGSYLMSGKFHLQEAIESAAKAAYIAAKIKTRNFEPISRYDGVYQFQFSTMPYNTLNWLRKNRNGAIFYWSKAVEILDEQNKLR